MKPFHAVLTAILLLFSISSIAQNLIAVTNETSSSFYETLDLAITNAKDGDVLYLPGRSFSISVPINKQLQIIGVGHNPDSCRATGITQITGNITITNGSNRGSLIGCKVTDQISFVPATGQSIDYYSIERCNLASNIILSAQSSNILINECIIGGIQTNSRPIHGIQVSKCVITISLSGFSYGGPISSNCNFINNIFLGSTGSLGNMSGCSFRNNIFTNQVTTSYWDPSIYMIFNNNLFLNGYILDTSKNAFTNSIIGPVTDLFVRKTKDGFDYDQDYHIVATSPAHNAGTDGTDLGIYGTASPWK